MPSRDLFNASGNLVMRETTNDAGIVTLREHFSEDGQIEKTEGFGYFHGGMVTVDNYEDGVVRTRSAMSFNGGKVYEEKYDETGRLTEKFELISDYDSNFLSAVTYHYDTKSGKIIESKEYDANGRILHEEKYDENEVCITSEVYNGDGALQERTEWKTDSDGNRVSDEKTVQRYNTTTGKVVETKEYDANGRILHEEKYDERGSTVESVRYSYDGGMLAEKETYATDPYDIRSYLDDADIDDPDRSVTEMTITEKYDENGDIRSVEYETNLDPATKDQTDSDENRVSDEKTVQRYDTIGRIVETKEYDADRRILHEERYDENGSTVESVRYSYNGGMLSEKETYTTDPYEIRSYLDDAGIDDPDYSITEMTITEKYDENGDIRYVAYETNLDPATKDQEDGEDKIEAESKDMLQDLEDDDDGWGESVD